MPTPSANMGGAVIVTPLSSRYNRNSMPLDANGEVPTPNKWFWGGDVTTITIRPEVGAKLGNPSPIAPRVAEIDVRRFFPGGSQ